MKLNHVLRYNYQSAHLQFHMTDKPKIKTYNTLTDDQVGAIGRTEINKAFMCINRSIAQPHDID